MLRGILWNSFIVWVVSLLIVWYLFVGLRYYFDEIKDVVTGRRKLQFRSLIGKNIPKSDYGFNYQESDEIFNSQVEFETVDPVFKEVEDLTASLKITITDATQKKLLKKEFEDKN